MSKFRLLLEDKMKNWLAIGHFAKQAGISTRTLRIYEDLGLIAAHARGENGYRYYLSEQLELIERIKKFKALGFSLEEIHSLLDVDITMDSQKLESFLRQRLESLGQQAMKVQAQKNQIENILSSLKKTKQGLSLHQRRFIMNQFEKFSVVVAGIRDLDKTAEYIREHIKKSGKEIPVEVWDGTSILPQNKPFIFVVSESLLKNRDVQSLTPDVVVIKELSESSKEIEKAYLQLFSAVGPHMCTILNADDRAVVELAGHETIRKGKTYYFSKNSGLQSQISKIGGAISDGENIQIYGFNQNKGPLEIKLKKILGFDEEVAFLASLTAVMDIGIKEETFNGDLL
jgi:DNA-binding transcriptional MerR regulator